MNGAERGTSMVSPSENVTWMLAGAPSTGLKTKCHSVLSQSWPLRLA
ncbi:MAG TPA: hypothetical protein VFY79_07405 [Dehalococcoidia bacterium]|nr:hypothetical protein [Dehalococcoidia bacterium]